MESAPNLNHESIEGRQMAAAPVLLQHFYIVHPSRHDLACLNPGTGYRCMDGCSAGFRHAYYANSALYCSRSKFFCTLPIVLRGNSATT